MKWRIRRDGPLFPLKDGELVWDGFVRKYYFRCPGACSGVSSIDDRWIVQERDGVAHVCPKSPGGKSSIYVKPCGAHFWIRNGETEWASDSGCRG